MIKLVDSHCHLDMIDLSGFEQNLDNVLEQCQQHGIEQLLNISVNLSSFPQVLETAKRYPSVHASVGIHPCYDEEPETDVDTLCQLAEKHDKVIAIGECGLDYYMNHGKCPRNDDFNWQRERFRTHIQAAVQCHYPLIIHTREAITDTLVLMKEENARDCGGVMHCYVEDWENAKKAMEMNFMISFSGIVSFKNARQLHDVARQVPDDFLLIETDSPYLAPVPHRGKVNQPAYVRHVAEALAVLRETTVEHIARITYDNYSRLFLSRVQ